MGPRSNEEIGQARTSLTLIVSLQKAAKLMRKGPGDFGLRRRRSSLPYLAPVCSLLAPCLAPKSPRPTRREIMVVCTKTEVPWLTP